MFSYNKNDQYKNECVAWLSRDGDKLMICSGKKNVDLCNFIAISPKVRKVDYETRMDLNPLLRDDDISTKIFSLDMNHYFSYLSNYSRITYSLYSNVKKEFLGLITGIGFPIVDIYGMKLNNFIYGMDIGFEFRISDNVSIYVDFGLIYKDKYGKLTVGVDYNGIELPTSNSIRRFGIFSDGVFTIKDNIPSNISLMFPGVNEHNILMLPNFSYIIRDLYTYVDEDIIHIFEANSNDEFDKKFSIALSNYNTNANRMRQIGANIFKKIATNKNLTTGMSEVASSAILQADDLAKVGHVNLCLSGNQDYISSVCKYEESRHQFLNVSHPDEELQYNLMYNASYINSLIGQCSVLTEENESEILDIVLKSEYNSSNNPNLHFIRNSDEKIIGFLPCLGSNPVSSSLTDTIEKEELQSIIIRDNVCSKADASNITADYMSQKEAIKDFEYQIKKLSSELSHINLDSIKNDLTKIDNYVANAFRVLASLIASQEILSSRGMVYLQQVDQILKMPLITSYSAISFGSLIEFFDIETLQTGISNVQIKENLYVPYLEKQTITKCGSTYTVLNSDPDLGYKNEVLVGKSYKSSISDLQGTFLTAYEKKYIITDRQTRGSGKSEREVVPLRETESRIVMRLEDLLHETKSMIHKLLNNDVLRSLAQIQNCINKVSRSVSSYSEMRKPYCNELVRYKEIEEKIFYLRHMINLCEARFDFGYLTTNSDFEYIASSSNTNELSVTQIAKANSVINCIDVKDKYIEFDPSIVSNRYANAITRIIRRIEKGNIIYNNNQLPENNFINAVDILDNHRHISEIAIGDIIILMMQENLVDCESVETTWTVDMVYFNYFVLDLDDVQALLDEYREYLSAREQFAHTFDEIRKKIDICSKEKHVIMFNDNEYYVDDENKFRITIDNDIFVFKYQIEQITDETVVKSRIDLIPNESTISTKFDSTISIRSLYYDIGVFLKHTEIFGLVPYTKYIDSKIKYGLIRDVNATYEQTYNKIREVYGENVANYYGKWSRGNNKNINPSQSDLLLSLLCEFDLAYTTIQAYQGKNLRSLLQAKNLDAGLLSAYEEDRKKLC